MFKTLFTIFIFIFTTSSSSKEIIPFQPTKPAERILIKRDYDEGLQYLKNKELKKEAERQDKIKSIIKEIEDSGFEVDEENKIISTIHLDIDNVQSDNNGTYYSYEYIDFKKLEELNKYSDEFRFRIENPIGMDFIIKAEKPENGMISSAKDPYVVLENDEDIPNSSNLHFSLDRLNFFIELLENNYMENFVFEYRTLNKKGKLKIDLDPETGKKIFWRATPHNYHN